MPLHPAEEATIRAFIKRNKRERYLSLLGNEKRRAAFLTCLNHCHDFDVRYASEIASSVDIVALLRSEGASNECYAISDLRSLDGRIFPLAEAVFETEVGGFGTIICCVPGQLAYYIDEAGSGPRLILKRSTA